MEPKELERLMKRMGLDVAALADELDVHQATVYRWLNGDSPMPGPAVKLVRILAGGKTRKGAA